MCFSNNQCCEKYNIWVYVLSTDYIRNINAPHTTSKVPTVPTTVTVHLHAVLCIVHSVQYATVYLSNKSYIKIQWFINFGH